jgi:YidC/Oxa1 family membrane protein insertase
MDKKNTTIGVLLLIAAFASLYLSQKYAPPPPAHRAPELVPTTGPNEASASAVAAAQPTSPADATFTAVTKDTGEPHYETLANDFIEVSFADLGGAIGKVALKKYDAQKAQPGVPYVINQPRGNASPALAFVDVPGLDSNTRYQLVSHSAVEVVYRTVLENRVEVTRRYTLAPGSGDAKHDPYQLRHETTFRNLTDSAQLLSPNQQVTITVGTTAPVNAEDLGLKLTAGYSTGSKQTFVARSKLEASGGFFGLGAHEAAPQISAGGPIAWATVNNQFFSTIFTPDTAASGFVMRRVKIKLELPSADRNAYGLTAETQFNLPALAPKAETKLAGDFYAGPKEYHRLSNAEVFKNDQDAVMQFGFFAFFSKILLTLMTWVHGLMPNASGAWGLAIVITTLILKIVFFPLTLTASKSAKRMQKIQPEMQALKEKYKDDPQKMQKETMELFKRHKVNPMGGCFPILITIPFFFGFFMMLQSTAELRFQSFLWAQDLSAADTVTRIFGIPLNIMPILMGITSIIQMRLTPQPTTDNMQAKMFKFMPYMFILFCYTYSCALAIYWTVGNIFTIGQQLIINRMKDAVDTPVPAEPMRGGRPAKNVTPPKKKG